MRSGKLAVSLLLLSHLAAGLCMTLNDPSLVARPVGENDLNTYAITANDLELS
jgi:hypothetical protein